MKRRRTKSGRIAIVIIALLCLVGYILVRDSAEHLELTRCTVTNHKLSQSFSGFKIVQLSDFHGAELVTDIVETVREQKPDIIALTGDFITDEGDLPAVEQLVSQLSDICEVYFISGNHDFASGRIAELSDILSSCGVKYLKNEYVTIQRGGERALSLPA